ncbi:hypothetical protein HPB48_014328 [Haemaphysalis longicornis]|uniref:Uncharacterized protein n=1 Tax=Haemaphysalis longicornis TaxID=44386 RepID=A0A9J6G4W5_HAELO|nr:hypothetical protein HPB48_014328 [Haemaphysalis longicornis]
MDASHTAPTRRLMNVGVDNTVVELIGAHGVPQLCGLYKTNMCRRLLERLGMTSSLERPGEMDLPPGVRNALRIQTLPKNMHALKDAGRGKARTKHLTKQLRNDPYVWYTDASPYRYRRVHCAEVINFRRDPKFPAPCEPTP